MSRVEYFIRCPKCANNGRDTRGDNLGVYDNGDVHCFSCGYHRFSNRTRKLEVFNGTKSVVAGPKAVLPFDFTWEVPGRSWQWLIQFGLPISYWQSFTGYSPAEERLVFRIGNPHQFSIGRSNLQGIKKWYVWGDPHKHAEIVPGKNEEIVVLVEDLISAHKIANAGITAVPLFGVMIHPCHLYWLNSVNSNVVLWLDKDQEFNVKKKALNLESLINKPVKVITTEKDPKCLNLENIQILIHSE